MFRLMHLGATGILPVRSVKRVPTSALAGCQWHPFDWLSEHQ
jgi:hypothetical protein